MKNTSNDQPEQAHEMLAPVEHPALNISYYPPITPRDFSQMEIWSESLPNDQVFRLMTSRLWRSDVEEFRERLFCSACDQIISNDLCLNCGQQKGLLTTVLDLIPVPSSIRSYLEGMAAHFLAKKIGPQFVLNALQAVNHAQGLPLDQEDVSMIFSEAAKVELKRRSGGRHGRR